MKKYIYLPVTALLLCMTSCRSVSESIDLNGDWKVSTINGKTVPETLEEVTLSFDNSSNSYHGVTGVNIINGTYRQHNQILTLEEGAMTRKMGDPVSNDVEMEYVNAIHAVKSVVNKKGKLMLQDEKGKNIMTLDRR